MRIVENEVNEYRQEEGIEGIYSAIRRAASVCYQTTEKGNKTDYEFFEMLKRNAHTRPMEFGTVYLTIPALFTEDDRCSELIEFFERNHWSSVVYDTLERYAYITTNRRVLLQYGYDSDEEAFANEYDMDLFYEVMHYMTKDNIPTEFHKKRRTFEMILSRGASDDFRTHISLSSICESTRWCNYSKGKFGGELTFINPYFSDCESILDNYAEQERKYLELAENGLEAQRLKRIIPLGIKAELHMCGYDEDWMNFIWRRCDSHADPECVAIACKIRDMICK